MADQIIDGYINAWLVPTIPNIAAPVAATIAAGTAIELLLTPEGLAGLESTTNWVNNSALGSTFDTQLPGTVSYGDMSLEFKWQAGVDTLFGLLTFGYQTNLVIRTGYLRSTAITAGQSPLEVYPITCGQYTRTAYERNSLRRFKVPIGLSSEPNLRAVCA
jgi:hypothetical protein